MPERPLPESAERFLESKRVERRLRRSTLQEYRRDLEDFCRWLAGRRRKSVDSLTTDDFASVDRETARKWLAHLDDRDLAPTTRARRFSTVSGCFHWLAAEGLIPRNPFARLERPLQGERHKRLPLYLSESEAERLLRVVLTDEGLTPRQKAHHAHLKERDYTLITLLLYQGLRISEAVNLRLGDVDFDEGTLRVIGKGDKERLLPLHRRTKEALQQYLQTWPGPRKPTAPQDPLWWTLTGQPLTKNATQVAVKRHLIRAGLWRASAHKLRHTFGTRLTEAGVDLLVIKTCSVTLQWPAPRSTLTWPSDGFGRRLREFVDAVDPSPNRALLIAEGRDMDARERTYQFLEEFKKLEEHLKKNIPGGRAMNTADLIEKAAHSNSVVRYYQNSLIKYKNLRNVLVHDRGKKEPVIAIPTEEALAELREIVSTIVHPPTLERFRKTLRIFTLEDPLADVLRHMGDNDYSQVVVRNNGKIDLLTVEGITRWLAAHIPDGIMELTATVADVLKYEVTGSFVVLSRKATIYDAVEVFSSSLRHGKPRVFAVIITENGRATEYPLGIVTPWDLLNLQRT